MYNADRCTFFTKMGACRHGDSCTKIHVRPKSSQTVLLPMMYPNPLAALSHIEDRTWAFSEFDKKYLKKHVEHFYKEVWRTFMEYGRIIELRVVSNQGDHLLGNVYVRFEDTAIATKVVVELSESKVKFNGTMVIPELSPVSNFAEACCKEDLEASCARGAQCNYLHIIKISRKLVEKLQKEQDKYWRRREREDAKEKSRKQHKRSRSNSASRSQSASPGSNRE